MTYRESLLDPRWQKRRLEMLQAANWECQKCGNPFETLHVHHKEYVRGRKPWEYTDQEMIVICETCHGVEHTAGAAEQDEDLESRIERAHEALKAAPADEQKLAWAVLASLLKERSPQRVKEMEFTKGISRIQRRVGSR